MTRFVISLLLTAVLMAAPSCKRPAQYRTMAGTVWHTTYHIRYESERDLDDSVMAVMRQVELSLSPFDSTSLVSALNRGEKVKADPFLRRVIDGSRRVCALSGGAFDPTVAPLVNLWGFGWTGDGDGSVPPRSAIDSVLAFVGMEECMVADDGSVIKKHPDTQFNFSAITKGLGCDEVGAMFVRNGVDNYMVEIGGEIAVGGVNPRGELWHLMIDLPVESDTAVVHEPLTVIELGQGGMATSGNYRNYRDTERGRVGHTISPVTGEPVVTGILSATVIAPDCMTADALATACMAMPPDSVFRMAASLDSIRMILVTPDSVICIPPELAGTR